MTLAVPERHASHEPPERARNARAPPHQRESAPSPFVFVSERGAPLSSARLRPPGRARKPLAADLGIKAHAHMLRHACGFKLANDGVDTRTIQAYLGHKSIQHTVRYTELARVRFKSYSGLIAPCSGFKIRKGTHPFQTQKS